MYIYAHVGYIDKIVQYFTIEEYLLPEDDFPDAIIVDTIDETWIQRKKWDSTTQTWLDVTLDETGTHNSLEYTHIDSNGVKHWLDEYIEDLASGGSVETATVTEVETYLSI